LITDFLLSICAQFSCVNFFHEFVIANYYKFVEYFFAGLIFLKEAAVMAGLGVIGRNNLLITPQYGANVRLRALFLDKEILDDKPLRFAPCDDCPAPCRRACPQNAFKSGTFQRSLCSIQMLKDEADQKMITMEGKAIAVVSYCRACEWACPVSRGGVKSET
jgi:epoxyqueuosine reductase